LQINAFVAKPLATGLIILLAVAIDTVCAGRPPGNREE